MAEYLIDVLSWPYWAAYLFAASVACALIIQVIAVGALVFIWLERKIAGRIQDRLGPTRVGGAFGWLQTLADGIKLIAKEDFTPGNADWVLFKFAPYLGFAAAFCALIAVPFGNGFCCVALKYRCLLRSSSDGRRGFRRDFGWLFIGFKMVAVWCHT